MLNALSAGGLSADWLVTVALLSIRIGAVLLFSPLLAAVNVPGPVRLLIVFGLSMGLAPAAVGTGAVAADASVLRATDAAHGNRVFGLILSEMAFGAALAVAVHLAFAVFSLAGRILDIQIGFGLAQVFDPSTNAVVPVLTTIFNQAAVIVFFMVDGHHMLLRGIAYSLQRFPLGAPWSVDIAAGPILAQAAQMLDLAFSLVAPIVFCILIVEFALALLSRSVPQMHMLTMGLPVKILIGLAVLSFWIAGNGAAMLRIYGTLYHSWDEWFGAVGAEGGLHGRR
ncbi:flagellar biosynthetic protein FliR [Trinickia diaoshuihuensis]|jgi:flagellar biosynthetic protein FliR|uniref:flagellar biosynthetic protein FliR n=1 Tax=Trinickia diaoshuihuensis TaxID=2292265 RepID=UPI000E24939F|nr:flagellar biosynthetic protein FliR [Trinickia diaoshuihuensis]